MLVWLPVSDALLDQRFQTIFRIWDSTCTPRSILRFLHSRSSLAAFVRRLSFAPQLEFDYLSALEYWLTNRLNIGARKSPEDL